MQLRNWVWVGGIGLSIMITAGCSGAGQGNTAEAAMPTETSVDALDELTATLEEMGIRPSTSSPQNPPNINDSDVVYLGDPRPLPEDGMATDVGLEVALLREHIHQLENSLTFYMDTVVTDLREENAYLRDELARIYATIPLEDRMRPVVPRPGSAVLNDVQDIAATPDLAARMNPPRSASSAPLELTVTKEWGRTPEEATEMGRGAKSLRGIIGSVPPGADDGSLLQFGRELRDQYIEYSNINIVVFDSEAAADAYAERNVKSTTRHVLTIARHAQTGLDEVYIHRNGLVVHTERY